MVQDVFNVRRTFEAGPGRESAFYSLPAFAAQGYPALSRLPVSIRILIESGLRNCDGQVITR